MVRSAIPTIVLTLLAVAQPARADEPTPQPARKAAERGLAFLESDAAKWRKERQCATCHHGAMTVWAHAEARSLGYAWWAAGGTTAPGR